MKKHYLIHYGRTGYGADYNARSLTDLLGFVRALVRDMASGESISLTVIVKVKP